MRNGLHVDHNDNTFKSQRQNDTTGNPFVASKGMGRLSVYFDCAQLAIGRGPHILEEVQYIVKTKKLLGKRDKCRVL